MNVKNNIISNNNNKNSLQLIPVLFSLNYFICKIKYQETELLLSQITMKKSGYDARNVEDGVRGTYMAHKRAENEYNSSDGELGKEKSLE